MDDVPCGLYIDGRWGPAASGATFPVHDPASDRVVAHVADAGPEDGHRALDAAARTRLSWASATPQERSEMLRRAYELLHDRRERIATVMTVEMGKPLAESLGEVSYAADFFRWFSHETHRISGRLTTAPTGTKRIATLSKPVGPTLIITPWNFPLAMGARKIAPAIAAGCTMVMKPAALTPLSTLLLAEVLHDAGLPAGVINVVPTRNAVGVTGPLIHDPRLRKLSFTGSSDVGRALLTETADQVLRVSMELGGNAPFMVLHDADLDLAVQGAMIAKLRNGGQACTAANRFLVHEAVADDFVDGLRAEFERVRLGHGLEPTTTLGPLIDNSARRSVHGLVAESQALGAQSVCGGTPIDGTGAFYPPTILTSVTADMPVMTNEVFGPVAPIAVFPTDKALVMAADATPYGLAAYLYTTDLERALSIAERIEVGMLGVNTGLVSDAAAPFGGVKLSGLGREGGTEGVHEYLETTYVAIPRHVEEES